MSNPTQRVLTTSEASALLQDSRELKGLTIVLTGPLGDGDGAVVDNCHFIVKREVFHWEEWMGTSWEDVFALWLFGKVPESAIVCNNVFEGDAPDRAGP